MKAWQISAHGGSEALNRVNLPNPVPGPMEVRIRVGAVGLNHLDVWVRKGVPGHQFPLPLIPGTDVSGTIDAFGPGAEAAAGPSLSVGSRVLVQPGFSCGRCEACLGGFDPLCPDYGILGETRDGSCAEFLVVPIQNLVPLPEGLPLEEAAALPIPYLTAWNMVFRKTQLRPGETILIQAGGSGVSIAAIQLAKLVGARVITTVGEDGKIEKARALGADHVIQYRRSPFREELKKILKGYGKRGVDVAIDHVGADTFWESVKSLAWGGRLACCGATSGSSVQIDLKVLFFKNIALHGATMGSKADLLRIVDLVKQGKLTPIIDRTLPMDSLPEALDLLEQRKTFGKIILKA